MSDESADRIEEQSQREREFRGFFNNVYRDDILEAASEGKDHVVIDCHILDKFDPDLLDALINEPDETLNAAQEALDNITFVTDTDLTARFTNLPTSQTIPIRNLRSKHLHSLVEIEGIIRRASEVRPEIIAAKFRCLNCGTIIEKEQESTKLKKPYQCSECGSKMFDVKEKVMRDLQVLTVEENPEDMDGSTDPARIVCFLRDELVDPTFQKNIVPGNKVSVTGVLNEMPRDNKKKTQLYDMSVKASHVDPLEQEFEDLEISTEEEKQIQELAQDPDIFNKITHSIAPSIYGLQDIKQAVALQMFGGVRKQKGGGHTIRGDIHLLLLGEPGTGKSQILKFVSDLAPKGKYVVGKSATGAGVTATAVKDEVSGGWSLEAGALVLANGGMAMIDEIDKMGQEDRSALHEAMEQQHITVSKATIQATLQCKAAILAAGNPKHGRFDPYGNISEQIDLSPTLISRFDLIFPLKDVPNQEKDEKLANHILDLHQKQEENMEESSPIPFDLLKKYVAYARRNVRPELTDAAREKIESFYTGLRSLGVDDGEVHSVPITARQLEALVRMAEASAKTRLSEQVEVKDAERAVNLLKHYLQQIGMDPESGNIDIDKIEVGITSSQRNKLRSVMDIIESLADERGGEVQLEEVKAEAESRGVDEISEIIQKLKQEGTIYEPRAGVIGVI